MFGLFFCGFDYGGVPQFFYTVAAKLLPHSLVQYVK
jgi:hypothetical protein